MFNDKHVFREGRVLEINTPNVIEESLIEKEEANEIQQLENGTNADGFETVSSTTK